MNELGKSWTPTIHHFNPIWKSGASHSFTCFAFSQKDGKAEILPGVT